MEALLLNILASKLTGFRSEHYVTSKALGTGDPHQSETGCNKPLEDSKTPASRQLCRCWSNVPQQGTLQWLLLLPGSLASGLALTLMTVECPALCLMQLSPAEAMTCYPPSIWRNVALRNICYRDSIYSLLFPYHGGLLCTGHLYLASDIGGIT